MKRLMHSYSEDQLEYVYSCLDDISEAVSDLIHTHSSPDRISQTVAEIKADWILGAVEDGLMTKEQFVEIYSFLTAK